MTGYRRRIPGLNSEQVMHAMGIDDAYRVQRVLVRNANGVTELVTIEDAGPFALRVLTGLNMSWASLLECIRQSVECQLRHSAAIGHGDSMSGRWGLKTFDVRGIFTAVMRPCGL